MSMNCPNCRVEMIAGDARIKGTLVGFLVIGLSYQHLFFKSRKKSVDEKPVRKKVLRSGRSTTAHHCEKCGLTALQRGDTF